MRFVDFILGVPYVRVETFIILFYNVGIYTTLSVLKLCHTEGSLNIEVLLNETLKYFIFQSK